jgi:hypothetical protein
MPLLNPRTLPCLGCALVTGGVRETASIETVSIGKRTCSTIDPEILILDPRLQLASPELLLLTSLPWHRELLAKTR